MKQKENNNSLKQIRQKALEIKNEKATNYVVKKETGTVSNNSSKSSSLDKENKKETRQEKKARKKTIKQIKKWNKKRRTYNKNFPNDKNVIIKLENVEKYITNGFNYEHILKGIDLSIYKGEFVVIVGPSGSGKTTLLSIISALDRPSKGDCYMFDKNTASLSSSQLTKLRAKHIGYIFQQYGLLDDLTVEDNIKIASKLNKQKKPLDIDQLLKSVELLEHKNKKAIDLSGGQAQRVAICRALVKNPDILFGDEPTGAVHVNATKNIMQVFLDINNKYKTTVVIVTHNNLLTQLASRIIRIENGLIVENYINKNRLGVEQINWTSI